MTQELIFLQTWVVGLYIRAPSSHFLMLGVPNPREPRMKPQAEFSFIAFVLHLSGDNNNNRQMHSQFPRRSLSLSLFLPPFFPEQGERASDIFRDHLWSIPANPTEYKFTDLPFARCSCIEYRDANFSFQRFAVLRPRDDLPWLCTSIFPFLRKKWNQFYDHFDGLSIFCDEQNKNFWKKILFLNISEREMIFFSEKKFQFHRVDKLCHREIEKSWFFLRRTHEAKVNYSRAIRVRRSLNFLFCFFFWR